MDDRCMTIKEMNTILNAMRSIYPFKDDKTYLYTYDLTSGRHNRVDITTKDDKTGITITMSKGIFDGD